MELKMSEYEKETKAFIKAIFSARKDEDDSPIKLILANADAKEHFKNSLPDFEGIGVELWVLWHKGTKHDTVLRNSLKSL